MTQRTSYKLPDKHGVVGGGEGGGRGRRVPVNSSKYQHTVKQISVITSTYHRAPPDETIMHAVSTDALGFRGRQSDDILKGDRQITGPSVLN